MRLLLAVLVMAMAVPALAGPYLISDPSSDNATSCVFESFPLAVHDGCGQGDQSGLGDALPVGYSHGH